MSHPPKLVLLSGATGFVGACLLRLLVQKGYPVRAMRRPNSRLDLVSDIADQVNWVEADVLDILSLEEAFEGVTHVCHCAGITSFLRREERRMMQVNVAGTANMVNFSLAFGIRQFVHISSIAALGRTPERPHIDERATWVNSPDNSRYAISKYLGEQEVWRGAAEGLRVAVVNPAIILGGGFWEEGGAKFFRQVYEGLPFRPLGRSGFVDVRDVALFILLLLEQDLAGERYILNAQNMPSGVLFDQIAAALHKKAPFIPVTPLLAAVAWRVEWLKSALLRTTPTVTRESARASLQQYTYGGEKALGVAGFRYRPLEDTIRETAALCQAAAAVNWAPASLTV
jgi:nucleoside-diphosphate-sugar epimerase